MPLQQPLRRGDWVTASAKNGSMIRGQAAHDMRGIGPAALTIEVAGDGDRGFTVSINVNYWDVVTDRANLIREGS